MTSKEKTVRKQYTVTKSYNPIPYGVVISKTYNTRNGVVTEKGEFMYYYKYLVEGAGFMYIALPLPIEGFDAEEWLTAERISKWEFETNALPV